MNIVKLALLDSGTYDQMYLRPYEVHDSPRNLISLQGVTQGGRNINAASLAGVAGEVLRPQASPLGAVQIANGWGNRRYRFFMEIVDRDLTGVETVQYLTGFTDHPGVSAGGHVDPNMRFYVASTIRMKCLTYATPTGNVNQMSVADTSHVMNHIQIPGVNFRPGVDALNLQRPEDICATVQTQQYRRVSDQFFDPRTTFAQENLKLSRRSNSIAPKYLSDVLQAGVAALNQADEHSNETQIWGQATGYVRENVYSQDQVLFELHRKTSFSEGDSFTYAELKLLCPHLDSVTKYLPVATMIQQQQMGPTPFVGTYTAGQYDGWAGVGTETVWATILSNAVPALMLDCMLKEAFFTIHNHTLNGEISVTFQNVVPLGRHLNGQQLAQQFEFRLKNEVVRDLRGGNPAPFSVTGMFDIIGESRLQIQVAGGAAVPFATPTFADNLFMPVLTMGQQRVNQMADNVEFFTTNLTADAMQLGTHSAQNHNTPLQAQGTPNASSYTL